MTVSWKRKSSSTIQGSSPHPPTQGTHSLLPTAFLRQSPRSGERRTSGKKQKVKCKRQKASFLTACSLPSSMKQNSCCSYNRLSLPLGCRLCVKGRKSVILITGICPRKCFYCPLSDQKYQKDVIYANERKVTSTKELIDEVAVSKSFGAGITGGDPLSVMDRTVETIKALKGKFGRAFHIHLYTSLVLATEKNLKRLHDAGLDEIRFHPDQAG